MFERKNKKNVYSSSHNEHNSNNPSKQLQKTILTIHQSKANKSSLKTDEF